MRLLSNLNGRKSEPDEELAAGEEPGEEIGDGFEVVPHAEADVDNATDETDTDDEADADEPVDETDTDDEDDADEATDEAGTDDDSVEPAEEAEPDETGGEEGAAVDETDDDGEPVEPVDETIPGDDQDDVEPVDEASPIEGAPTRPPVEVAEGNDGLPDADVDVHDPDLWTARQIVRVGWRVLAVIVLFGLVGSVLGAARGTQHTARSEFVYTLDESIPDAFLREDRRLLTQVVAFESDAVLTPVAGEFGLTVDELRSKIDVETVELSEILRLDVSDADPDRARLLGRAVVDEYLRVTLAASPAGDGAELTERRAELLGQLAGAEAARQELQRQDIELEIQQNAVEEAVGQQSERIERLQQSIDEAIAGGASPARRSALNNALADAQQALDALELELNDVRASRLELTGGRDADQSGAREIARLEAMLTTIDAELAERELGPLVASPLRALGDPVMVERSAWTAGLQGLAIGLLLALPLAALVAYLTRSRQRWYD